MSPDDIRRMQMLARIGLDRKIVGALLSAFGMDTELSADDRRFLVGPLVVHESGWNETRPPWFERLAVAERIGIVFGLTPDLIVGPAEIAAVMYGAALDAPLRHDYQDLYLWAVTNTIAMHRNRPVEAICRDVLGMEPITDAMVLRPGGRLYETYRSTASDIRRHVVAAQAERERTKRREGRAPNTAAPVHVPPPAIVSQSLFDIIGG